MRIITRGPFLCLSISLFLLLSSCFGCNKHFENGAVYDGKAKKQIEVGSGPEDILIDNSVSPSRLLVSCDARRESEPEQAGIWVIDPQTSSAFELERKGEPVGMVFHPHGIDLFEDNLYVISHNDDKDVHSIIIYKVNHDQLLYIKTLNHPLLNSPNALTILPGENLLITNDSGKRGNKLEALLKKKKSTVIHYDASLDSFTVAAKDLAYANGITWRGSKIYVATTRQHTLFEFDYVEGKLENRKGIAYIKGMDNLRWYKDQLLTTSHPKVLQFIKHAKSINNKSECDVWLINPELNTQERIFGSPVDPELNSISAASTALIFNGKLYIAQVFDSFILEVQLD
jgi:hypothetical protein